jgi:hypothetical protein
VALEFEVCDRKHNVRSIFASMVASSSPGKKKSRNKSGSRKTKLQFLRSEIYAAFFTDLRRPRRLVGGVAGGSPINSADQIDVTNRFTP